MMEKLKQETKTSEPIITIIPLSEIPVEAPDEEQTEEQPISEFGVWEEWPNPNGVSYFFNKETGKSQWNDPRLEAGAAAASAVLGSLMEETSEKKENMSDGMESKEKINIENTSKRYLLRDASMHMWEEQDIDNLKNDMLLQMQILQEETRKSGIRMPTLRKKYRPVRPPPVEPPAPKGTAISFSPRPERPKSLQGIPIPIGVPPLDLPFTGKGSKINIASEMSRSRSTGDVPKRGRPPNRQLSSSSDYLSTQSLLDNVYIVVSDYASDDGSKLQLKVGEKITLQSKKYSGWWLGKNQATGRSGYFPGSYVKKLGVQDIAPTTRRSKSQDSKKIPRMWSGKLMHDRSQRKRPSARRKTSRKRSARMGE